MMTTEAGQDRGDTVSAEAAAEAAALAKSAGETAQNAETGAADTSAEEGKSTEVSEADKAEKAAADAARDEKGRFIPKSRFDEQVGKERTAREAAEREVMELRAQLKQVDAGADVAKIETEIVALEKDQAKAVLEGDTEKAAALASQIRLKERTIQIQASSELSERAKNEAREEVRMDAAIERLESAYPQLNKASDEFDQDLVDFVLARQMSLIQNERMLPSEALAKAAQQVMSKMGTMKTPETTEPDKGLGAAKAKDRSKQQVAKNVETAGKQPASMKEVGMDSDKAGIKGDIDVSKMSQDEFNALPDATKQRLRGDLLD